MIHIPNNKIYFGFENEKKKKKKKKKKIINEQVLAQIKF